MKKILFLSFFVISVITVANAQAVGNANKVEARPSTPNPIDAALASLPVLQNLIGDGKTHNGYSGLVLSQPVNGWVTVYVPSPTGRWTFQAQLVDNVLMQFDLKYGYAIVPFTYIVIDGNPRYYIPY